MYPRQNLKPCNVERTGGFEASLRLVQIVVVVPGEEIDEAGGREEWQAERRKSEELQGTVMSTQEKISRMAAELDAVKDAKEKLKEELGAKIQKLTSEKQKREKELRELQKQMGGIPGGMPGGISALTALTRL